MGHSVLIGAHAIYVRLTFLRNVNPFSYGRKAMQNGRILYLMGPSGAGKDTLLSLAKGICHEDAPHLRPLYVATRYITRPPSESIEKHISVSKQEFLYLLSTGHFLLHWQSHGHFYGIGKDVNVALAQNCIVLMNGSRAYLPQAQKLFPDLLPVLLHVRYDILQERLWQRGRESAQQIEERLHRNILLDKHSSVTTIENSGSLEDTLHTFKALLTQHRTLDSDEKVSLLPQNSLHGQEGKYTV